MIILSPKDIAASIAAAEQRLGCTFDQLAEMARTHDYPSLQHRIAWVLLGGFHKPAQPARIEPMTERTPYPARELEQHANELLGDEVVLKLHDGQPGPDCTANLVDGDGRPTILTRTNTRPVQFVATHQSDRNELTRDYYVSIWDGDVATSLLRPDHWRPGEYVYKLAPGDTITISSFPHIRVHS